MKRRSFLKFIPFATASVATAAKAVVPKEKEWREFSGNNPKHDIYFKIKNKETGDIRIGYIKQYPQSKVEFLLRKVKVDDNRSTVIDKRAWKEWVWQYTDDYVNDTFIE